MKDCYYDLGLHFILLDDSSQSYILKLRDRSRLHILRSSASPIKLQCHLNLSRIIELTSNLAEVTTANGPIRLAETGMVEGVEKLCPKLDSHSFTKPVQRNFFED